MAINWKAISDNLVNISLILTDFMDTNDPKNIEWTYTDNEGNESSVLVPNIAKVLQEREDDLANTVETTIGEYLMFSNVEPTSTINPKYKGFLYVKYDSVKPDRSELYVCVDNTTDNNVWGRLIGGDLNIFVNSNITLNVNTKYYVDTTIDNITLSLPDSADDNDKIIIADARHNATNKPVTVECGTYNINGASSNLICDVSGFSVGLIYDSADNSWYTYNAVKGE